ncbi:MAG TPA: hypothetical protein VM097_10085, partial [Mycobacteriales bacterium]|nr:hypothetical protein [Mycobacteriales bacterium]
MRPRHAVLSACAVVVAATTVASALGTGPLPAVQVYDLLHGGLGADRVTATAGALPSTPRARCARGSRPETGRQGRVALSDYPTRAARGYTCNVTDIGHEGDSGGFQV